MNVWGASVIYLYIIYQPKNGERKKTGKKKQKEQKEREEKAKSKNMGV